MIWSGTPTGNGGRAPQQIYIAHMSDPLHIDQDYRRLIGNPDQSWETSVASDRGRAGGLGRPERQAHDRLQRERQLDEFLRPR